MSSTNPRPSGRDVSPLTPTLSPRGERERAFTIVELLVVLGIVVILASIFIPYLLSIRERSNRTRCANNLRQIRDALVAYASNNDQNFPRVVYDEQDNPNGYVAFSGPDDPDPFAPDSAVLPNDVSASLWLLVRRGLVTNPSVFTCPSSNDWSDHLADASGKWVDASQRSNFRSPSNLSYSYASPFSSAEGYRLNPDWLKHEFALLADQNPGTRGSGDDVTGPSSEAQPRELMKANSNNHDKTGQNVLFGDGHVSFESTPYCGVERDNIYTVLSPVPLAPGESPPASGNGYVAQNVAPVWNGDSYLVPTDDDAAPPRKALPTTTTAPTTTTTAPAVEPATAPATQPVTQPATTTSPG